MIKIDVVTGFLGAGKTTFIQYILNQPIFEGEKVVIIENEFGVIPVDGDILKQKDYKIIELSGGCICCALRSKLVDTLIELSKTTQVDRVLIEPSGVFVIEDMQQLFNIKAISEHFYLNGIYTLLDYGQFSMEKIRSAPFYNSQLKYADHIFVTKLKNQEKKILEKLKDDVAAINGTATLHLLPISSLNQETIVEVFGDKDFQPFYNSNVLYHPHTHSGVVSHGIQQLVHMTKDGFKGFIDDVKHGRFGEVIRMKGYISITDQQYLLNYVHPNWTITPSSERKSTLTLIGYGLKTSFLDKVLRKA